MNAKYDFSRLSRGRLRAFDRMVREFERQQANDANEWREVSDEDLEMLSAAGIPYYFNPMQDEPQS